MALPLLAVGTTTVSPMSTGHRMLQFFTALVQVSDFLFFPTFDTASGIAGKSFFIQLVDFLVVSILAFCFFASEDTLTPRKSLISEGKVNPLI